MELTTNEKSAYAQQLINNPLFKDIFITMRESFLQSWETTSIKDKEDREDLWGLYRLSKVLEERVNAYVATALIEEHNDLTKGE